jgi:hypothetical protein
MKSPSHHCSEQHPYFPSGDWEGFYNDPRGRRPQDKMAMSLDFASGKVTGSGSDPVGAYIWSGTYDPKAETCQLTKQYVGAHSVEYSGYADENGIWGKWGIRSGRTGEFHIWPKKLGATDGEKEEKEAVQAKTGQMVRV